MDGAAGLEQAGGWLGRRPAANNEDLLNVTVTDIPGVTLIITGPDGDPVTDVNGNEVGPQVTDESGRYLFPDLPILRGGEAYTVTVDKEASDDALKGLGPTKTGQGDRATDSSVDFATSEGLTAKGQEDPENPNEKAGPVAYEVAGPVSAHKGSTHCPAAARTAPTPGTRMETDEPRVFEITRYWDDATTRGEFRRPVRQPPQQLQTPLRCPFSPIWGGSSAPAQHSPSQPARSQ